MLYQEPSLDITLPSGHHVTLRDTFMRGDVVAARKALKFDMDADGTRHMDLSVDEAVNGAIMRAMIIGWDFPSPLPREAATAELADGVLNTVLDADDDEALTRALRPWYLKVMRRGGDEDPNSRSGATVISISAEPAGQEIPST